MAITYYKVDQYSVDWICDKCKEGFMRPYATIIKTKTDLIRHKCNKCIHTQSFPVVYPMQIVVPEGDEIDFQDGKETKADA